MTVVYTGPDLRLEQERRGGNKARVLEALRAAGAVGCTNAELVAIGGMRACGARIPELRHEGHDISDAINEGGGLFRYVLTEPTRVLPGTPGFLASLPVVAEMEPSPEGKLF